MLRGFDCVIVVLQRLVIISTIRLTIIILTHPPLLAIRYFYDYLFSTITSHLCKIGIQCSMLNNLPSCVVSYFAFKFQTQNKLKLTNYYSVRLDVIF